MAVTRWNKIKVSGRLSGKTVLARAHLELVSARESSCFPGQHCWPGVKELDGG
jgi:hypothetical protein